jgi:myo-inositol-1-phosphate synthase
MNRKRKYKQNVLIGQRKRPAILETCMKDTGTTFTIIHKDKVIATRSTSRTQDEQTAIMRLSKAVSGLAYVFVIPVPQAKEPIIERYFKVNN